MGDLYVHVKLKACCQKTLAELDEKKKAAKVLTGLLAVGPLLTMFGDKPVDTAIELLAQSTGKRVGERLSGSHMTTDEIEDPAKRASEIDIILHATCAKICTLHALQHTGTEARFWNDMAEAFERRNTAARR